MSEALSKLENNFSFLQGSEAATVTTPLEAASGTINRFAKYNTGTLALAISPAIVEQCSALRNLQITAALKKLSSVVAQLQTSFENNGQIRAIVDPSLIATELPYVGGLEDFTDDMKERSTMHIEYIDATPTIQGTPVWDRLPGERVDFYNVFKLYRDSRYFLLDTGEYAIVNRTLAGLARTLTIPGVVLTYLSKLYSWSSRCKLFDAYMELEAQKMKQQSDLLLQNDHLKVASALCKQASDYLAINFANLNPKEALQALELGIKYSRISAGLLPDKPGNVVTGNQTNLSIYNTTTHNTADQLLNVNANVGPTMQGGGSAVERQLQEDMKKEDNILSVLHVLQASGAMKSAIHADLRANGEEGLGILVDATDVEEEVIDE